MNNNFFSIFVLSNYWVRALIYFLKIFLFNPKLRSLSPPKFRIFIYYGNLEKN